MQAIAPDTSISDTALSIYARIHGQMVIRIVRQN